MTGRPGRRARLISNSAGVALIEFAIVLPVLTVLIFYGIELANYMLVRQRVSQLALQVADNASRIGVQEVLRNRPITEAQINDLFVGAGLQGGTLNVPGKGKIILSGLTVNASGGQWIQWQRCYGSMAFPSHYGVQGDGLTGTSFAGMGPATAKMTATSTSSIVFTEVGLTYTPLFWAGWVPTDAITEIAALAVRDDRDTSGTGIHNDENAPVAAC